MSEPAFPSEGYNPMYRGLAMRDYFAARMMVHELAQEKQKLGGYSYQYAAKRSYEMADAMLEARKIKGD